jgi:hypothetical protein
MATTTPTYAWRRRSDHSEPTQQRFIDCFIGRAGKRLAAAPENLRDSWWAREGFRSPTHSKAYRVPLHSGVPLNSKVYF